MDQLFQTLFNQTAGTAEATILALDALGVLLTGIALLLLARRNDLGWWFQIIAVFAGPMVIALQFGYDGFFKAVPYLLVPIYGLWRFSKYRLQGKFGRAVEVRSFTASSLVWGFVITLLIAFASALPTIFSGQILGSIQISFWLTLVFSALVPAGLVGVANGFRWAWLVVAASAVAQVAVYFGNQPAFATLGVLVLQFGASLFGWWAWRQLPAEAVQDDTVEYPPSPYQEA
ncbi:MAG: nicotinamide mononucleotide transporter [Arthrobacter sp.]|uniref:nicotinamide mononucleotide transporter n=1 Tax=Arthrobacter TaxID=1663 RepID=UPI00264F6E22|nr:nicotinamide mononucleotide transporter [Micrococcaceae bacterium]MDN5813090.1 nicotinamide mononucleotide transporter [Micrococcaceae bacterium]MDN5823412.1 nicotinamide mononucleotide transporter [Micrococcaceae bacterium]MDN5880442.1 nicotinamide mononucleotide transporter [Micrococcaceae bacterium]MDN5887842.1 nicotinamide mononucleotide transporter [Micrococcaceae bacterium]